MVLWFSDPSLRPRHIARRIALLCAFVVALPCAIRLCAAEPKSDEDPLASWNDGAAKKAFVDFVRRVTEEGGVDFVPTHQRIATFDNDGTLWVEQPIYTQVVFAVDRIKALAPEHPEWASIRRVGR